MNVASKLAEPLTWFLNDIIEVAQGLCRHISAESKPLDTGKQGWLWRVLEWWGTKSSVSDRIWD